MSCTVTCHVCGVWVVSISVWCSCGGVSSVRSPLTLVVGGAIVDGGVASWMVGGMMSEGRLCVGLPVECQCPPSVCWRPPCRLPYGPIEWRGMWAVCCPVFGLGLAPCIVLLPSYCPVPLLSLCLLSQYCWFRVVSLWNSGDGLCWVEGRVVFIVYTSSVLWCASRWCVLWWQCVMTVHVLSCCIVLRVVEWRWCV